MDALAKAFVAFALLVGCPWGYSVYKRHPVEAFCRGLPAAATRERVIADAEVAGLWINPLDRQAPSLWIYNQRAPWWRYACVVEFDARHGISAKVMAAD